MQPIDIEMIAQEILAGMPLKDKAAIANTNTAEGTPLEGVFDELTREDDETSKAVLRKIWDELQVTYRIRRIK
jgi:hypothetical protein